MTKQESAELLCTKLNISYDNIRAGTDDLFNWNDLYNWLDLACLEAWDYSDWIFKEKAYTTTTVASQEYYDYPSDFVEDSIFLLRVAGSDGLLDTYQKIRYTDFMQYREQSPTGQNKVWSDHRNWYFINPKAFNDAASRSIEVWGMIRFTELTASTSSLPFSPNSEGYENSGNHAIVKLAYAMALESEKKNDPQKAIIIRSEAYATLKLLADKEAEKQADYEVYGRPFFKHTNLFPDSRSGKHAFGDDDSWNF